MKLNAYAKINLILNVLGPRPDGYHEVSMLMQAISLADEVTVTFGKPGTALRATDFEYGESDLAWKAALLMAQTFRPDLLTEQSAILGVGISIDKHIPAAAGLAGGSSDAAAVLVGLGKLWHIADTLPAAPGSGSSERAAFDHNAKPASLINDAPCNIHTSEASSPDGTDDRLLQLLLPLGAKLGSDVPFCIAAQLGHPAAIATGTGTDLEFVRPIDSGVALYFSERTIPNKTRAVYAELTPDDCRPIYDIRAFLAAAAQNDASQPAAAQNDASHPAAAQNDASQPAAADRSQRRLSAKDLALLRSLLGNHLQAPAERLMERFGIERPTVCAAATPADAAAQPLLCGAGPTYFALCPDGPYRTILT